MTDTTDNRALVERLLDPIRKHIEDVEAEHQRFSYIAATIQVNAMKRGATDEQIKDFLTGKLSFIAWIVDQVDDVDSRVLRDRAEKAEAERDTAWNDAIEAAAECVGHITQSEDRDAIMALRKGEPT